MKFKLPDLPYPFDALEPYIDAATMEVHHGKHHQAYVDNLNKAVVGTLLEDKPIETILKNVSKHGDAVRNNGGGHYNHTLFWTILSPQGGGDPSGELAMEICENFGSIFHFKVDFARTAASLFGSGWAWLYVNDQQQLQICSTPNQDNPLMDTVPLEHRGTPILGLDVWEHAYYLHYKNRKHEYIGAFWDLVNWQEVERRFQDAI